MEELRDLSRLYNAAASRFEKYDGKDFMIPQTFKDRVTEIDSSKITYNDYSAVIETSTGQNIFLPNQWFYIASYFTDLYNELMKYKKYALTITSRERLKELKGGAFTTEEKNQLEKLPLSNESKSFLFSFITDYDWWKGAKTIDRGDFYVSCILSSAKLVNASQSCVADLCAFLADKKDLVDTIIEGEDRSRQDRLHDMDREGSKGHSTYRPFITAIKSKPFLLLAGISGTGKSRIVRELARACWDVGSEEYKAQKPRNFEMVQVKPNWHDSSELIGYVSRIDGVRYVVGPFLKFMVKAMQDPNTPYFLCLDEMNLAPVEQYFAEYLSVIESRKKQEDGTITTDPIVDYSNTEEYGSLIHQLFPDDDDLRKAYLTEDGGKRLSIPQNLIVVGTVNMDETTFSFSRKVLDRAMTIEMNEVDLRGGLTERHEKIGKIGVAELIGIAVEGVDVYKPYEDVCKLAIEYLEAINDKLEGTPFKIAYRTRNEALLYVVNNLPYNKGNDGEELQREYIIARALDEITNMKILSRIEGDETKVSSKFLEELDGTIKSGLKTICPTLFTDDGYASVSSTKIDEMKKRLASGYTSFWS
jgi:hypothetical protein